jgi:hypothetical protein
MKTFLKIFALFALLLVSFVPLLTISPYILSGLDRTVFITVLQSIPEDRFWVTGIPLFIMSFYATAMLLLKLIYLDTGTPRHDVSTPRKPVDFYVEDPIRYYPTYCVEDPNLGKKLSALYFPENSIT